MVPVIAFYNIAASLLGKRNRNTTPVLKTVPSAGLHHVFETHTFCIHFHRKRSIVSIVSQISPVRSLEFGTFRPKPHSKLHPNTCTRGNDEAFCPTSAGKMHPPTRDSWPGSDSGAILSGDKRRTPVPLAVSVCAGSQLEAKASPKIALFNSSLSMRQCAVRRGRWHHSSVMVQRLAAVNVFAIWCAHRVPAYGVPTHLRASEQRALVYLCT